MVLNYTFVNKSDGVIIFRARNEDDAWDTLSELVKKPNEWYLDGASDMYDED